LSECRFITEDGGMGQETKRSAEMRRVLEEYAASGLTRQEFCRQRSIALTTFDYWRREHAMRPRKKERRPRLVRVEVGASEAAGQGFTLKLANGRRIESSWRFAEAALSRLIRIAESA
jgi:hypothetical protein